MSRERMKLTGSAASQGTRGPDASGRREACWNSDPADHVGLASSVAALDGSSVAESSSGLAYSSCSYVEHSFLLLHTIPAVSTAKALTNVLNRKSDTELCSLLKFLHPELPSPKSKA